MRLNIWYSLFYWDSRMLAKNNSVQAFRADCGPLLARTCSLPPSLPIFCPSELLFTWYQQNRVLGKLIFEKAAGYRLYNSIPFCSFFFPEPPPQTMKPLRKATVQTDRFCQSIGLWPQVLQQHRQRYLLFSVSFFLVSSVLLEKELFTYIKYNETTSFHLTEAL